MPSIGVILALVALVSWGFGDFLLQKSARRFGSWESVFSMSFIGTIVLFPFVISSLMEFSLSSTEVLPFLFLTFSFFCGVFLGVEALKRGKLSIVESVGVVEIPIIGIFSYSILGENLAPSHWIFVGLLLVGVLLVALRSHSLQKVSWLEPGAFLGLLAGLMFGITGFMVGYAARETNPVLTVWGFNVVMAVVSFVYLLVVRRLPHFVRDFRNNKGIMIGVGVLDAVAWLTYAMATLYVPLVIAGVLSEGYIVLAILLGVLLNKERLHPRQVLGIATAVFGAIMLSTIYS